LPPRENLQRLVAAARGDAPADALLTGARVVNLFTREVIRTEVALAGGYVAGFGPHEALEEVDCGGGYLVPGLMDAHMHVESCMVTPRELARAVVPRGTTALVTDAHEIANVHGLDGVRWVLEATEGLPLDVFLMLPSCVPATPLETSGASLSAADLAPLLSHPRVLGLGEVMNAPAVISGAADVMAKISDARGRVDGHAVGLTGHRLEAYVAAGVESDHEAVTLAQGRERVRLGMHVMIRQGTTEQNLEALLPLLRGPEAERCMLCTDDRHPHQLLREGHMDDLLRRAVAGGVDPILALRAATRLPASYFELHRRGAIAPGFMADLALVDDLAGWRTRRVWKSGRLVAMEGALVAPLPAAPPPPPTGGGLRWRGAADLRVPDRGGEARVIRALPDQILTREERARPAVRAGAVAADPERDLLLLAVAERHRGSGAVGVGLVRGFGLTRGALASTVAHDSHNVIGVGVEEADLALAMEVASGGGLAVVAGGEVLARLALPVAGLMSERPLEEVAEALDGLNYTARTLGCVLPAPFMTLSFLALPPVPALRLSDQGLVDVAAFTHVPLFVEG
jgi:adenine deaminase